MNSKRVVRTERAGPRNLRALKWATIVLPLVFILAVNYVFDFLLPDAMHIHSAASFVVLMAVRAAAGVGFSQFIFTLVTRAADRSFIRPRRVLTWYT